MFELRDVLVTTTSREGKYILKLIPTNFRAIELADLFLNENKTVSQVGIEIDTEEQLEGFGLVPSEAALIVKRTGDISLQVYITGEEFIEFGLWREEIFSQYSSS